LDRAGGLSAPRSRPRKPLPFRHRAGGAFFWLARAVSQGCADERSLLIHIKVL
jgi:hypothetical protein